MTDTQERHKIIPHNALPLIWPLKKNFLKFLTPTRFLQHHRPIAAYKRNENLHDRLVQSKLRTPTPLGRVGRCKYFVQSKWVMSRYNKKIFKIPRPLTHETTNCIYLVFCVRCRRQYVGQTKNELRIRAYQHAHNIVHKLNKRHHLVQNFLAHGLPAFRVTCLQTNPAWSLSERLTQRGLSSFYLYFPHLLHCNTSRLLFGYPHFIPKTYPSVTLLQLHLILKNPDSYYPTFTSLKLNPLTCDPDLFNPLRPTQTADSPLLGDPGYLTSI